MDNTDKKESLSEIKARIDKAEIEIKLLIEKIRMFDAGYITQTLPKEPVFNENPAPLIAGGKEPGSCRDALDRARMSLVADALCRQGMVQIPNNLEINAISGKRFEDDIK